MATATPKSKTQPAQEQLSLRSASPIFTCNDLKASARWYRDVLGFKVVDEYKADDGTVTGMHFQAGDVNVHLAQDDFAKGRDRKKGVGFRIYCNTTQDIDALATSIKQRGGKLTNEPTTLPWGDRVLAVTDPDGFLMSIGRPPQS